MVLAKSLEADRDLHLFINSYIGTTFIQIPARVYLYQYTVSCPTQTHIHLYKLFFATNTRSNLLGLSTCTLSTLTPLQYNNIHKLQLQKVSKQENLPNTYLRANYIQVILPHFIIPHFYDKSAKDKT